MLDSTFNNKCFRFNEIVKAQPLCCKATVLKAISKKGIVMSSGQIQIKGVNMEKKRFVVLELTDDEEKELNEEGEVSNMTKLEDKKMTEQLQESKQKRIWVDRFDEEDWKALFTKDLEEFFEYDKDYLRVF
jgi:predicted ATP-binding protein involved in virulence